DLAVITVQGVSQLRYRHVLSRLGALLQQLAKDADVGVVVGQVILRCGLRRRAGGGSMRPASWQSFGRGPTVSAPALSTGSGEAARKSVVRAGSRGVAAQP